MRLFRTIAVTFALYSRIPMPHFEWKDEDMRYSIALFPWVGAVIGGVFVCVFEAAQRLQLPLTAVCLLMTAVPLLLTGGFHIDGFMDVSDALSSFGSREEKLRIMSDPHTGAFAVIRLCICGMIYIASLAVVLDCGQASDLVRVLGTGFFAARGLSAVSVLNFRSAKNEGMLYYEASCAGQSRKTNNILCVVWLALSAILMVYFHKTAGAAVMLTAAACFAWYKYKSSREFGGISGDTSGWFVTVCETSMAAAAAVTAVYINTGR